jgi:hypothetical protein
MYKKLKSRFSSFYFFLGMKIFKVGPKLVSALTGDDK